VLSCPGGTLGRMPSYPSPSPTYIGPAAKITSGPNRPIARIVIHMTVSPCIPGAARATARYFQSDAAGGSAHYCVDPEETVQCVYDGQIAQHAPPNQHSLGIEMCGYPESNPVKAAINWAKPSYRKTLRRTAYLTAQLALAEDIPATFLRSSMSRLDKGITTHDNVSDAFHQSTHWDPGVWPRRRFMRQVRRHMKKMKRGSTK
jgi:hypothetical protein